LPSDFKLEEEQILDTQTSSRKIFWNVKFTEDELKHIDGLK